ncbi:alpha/beta fold hydrolase [Membranicola marinus]|uniref:Alpha/beta fold hydrolase n=1 Tax=Membranihabitans marinus TaxID=1227546 RepID=A0A953HTM4_9BACT|nr:alpha/beta fold hydrolase [Membranihabitans marinus]MBY5957663.1 alpha/beta fold hydrolase [Membranihabitans marinus]
MKLHRFYLILFSILVSTLCLSCHSGKNLSGTAYYNYDQTAPLNLTTRSTSILGDTFYEIEFTSTHHEAVTGILSYPDVVGPPLPVIILVHGLGDHKNVDYIAGGEAILREAGYAVLRIDLYNHGARKEADFDFSFDGSTRYRSREVITQSVFDLRRALDFIETRPELDPHRIGYYGISLGGIIGTIFAGVDERVKVPVITLAGGRLNLMYGIHALTKENKNYLSTIDPIHFVKQIAPRPLLMINAEQDEVIPPATSKFLYKKAGQPKDIIWYPATHRTIPIEEAYKAGLNWFRQHL